MDFIKLYEEIARMDNNSLKLTAGQAYKKYINALSDNKIDPHDGLDTLFAICSMFMFADGQLHKEEVDFLNELFDSQENISDYTMMFLRYHRSGFDNTRTYIRDFLRICPDASEHLARVALCILFSDHELLPKELGTFDSLFFA